MLVNIDQIIISDRIREDFGNLEELAEEIRTLGLIHPPIVAADSLMLLAGERRLRAMKLLGYQQIEVRLMNVRDAEHALNIEISENESRKDFSKTERVKYAKRLERIEAAKARERMLTGKADPSLNSDEGRVDEIVAKKLGIGGKDTYRKEKYIVDNQELLSPEEFAEWDESKLSTNKAYQKIKSELNAQKSQNEQLKKKLEEAQNAPIKVKQIIPADYESDKAKLSAYEEKIRILENRSAILEKRAELHQEDADRYQRLKSQIEFLSQKKNNLARQISSATELSGLTVELQRLLEEKLAPIKFKRCMDELENSEIAMNNLMDIVDQIDRWSDEIKKIMKMDDADVVIIQ